VHSIGEKSTIILVNVTFDCQISVVISFFDSVEKFVAFLQRAVDIEINEN